MRDHRFELHHLNETTPNEIDICAQFLADKKSNNVF